jgi:multidrug resistance efflux pump
MITALQIKHKFPVGFLFIMFLCIFLYHCSYHFPFTNNAFVVANIRPVAANVHGYITAIYVNNEEYVTKGQPLFTVFPKPYQLAYQRSLSDVKESKIKLKVFAKAIEKTQYLLQSEKDMYEKINYDYQHNRTALREHAVSEITVHNLRKQAEAAQNKIKALSKEIEWYREKIIAQKMKIQSLTAIMRNAKVDLDETTVYAQNDGIVQNMYTALGAPIEIRQPIFSFVNTETMFIQANFNETDLRNVQPGNKVTIYPRIYSILHPYEGVVISKNWAASRQITDIRSQQQIVVNNVDHWILLPQRFPVQIKIINYDPIHFPLSIGASTYVYIHTGTNISPQAVKQNTMRTDRHQQTKTG